MRIGLSLGALALSAALGIATGVQAQVLPQEGDEFSMFGEASGWTIFVNESRGTCLAERVDDASVLQMGLTADATLGYLGVFTQDPTGIETNTVERVEIEIGGQRYAGEVAEMANLKEGYSGGYILANNAEFIQAVADQPSMTVFVADREPLEISLAGTKAAIQAAQDCNAAQAG